ncbi:hypothetical protein [Polynucleobacter sp. MWH-HuK1]|uniref:hypothetical protein n=1 Tax=Polynucleobacter sp. MWH-HuK1 TaxID=1743158 RepID=UPI001C0E4200|nr:hypothetical protein [Polynucleobacter sp. MWH-HuK1]MBU3565063.1 hypothetical protein [Polynucleobacter sp. MWH-HuK1]
MNIPLKSLALIIGIVLASGCTIKANVTKHDEQSSIAAKNFTPHEKLAKVYFLTTSKDNWLSIKGGYSADLKINGALIGSINDDNVMYFNLAPGTYTFEWFMRSSDFIESRATSVELPYRVAAGDVVILRGKYNAGGSAGFGLIGALISPPKYEMEISKDRDLIKELVIAAPQSCPPTICISADPTAQKSQDKNKSISAQERLNDLNEMRRKGLITQKDYDTKKAEILKSM